MSEKSSKKLVRNGQSMNDDDKKRSTENKSSSKKNVEKKVQKENEKQKKKINWEEEKDVLQAYRRKTYPLTKDEINLIIEEKDLPTIFFIGKISCMISNAEHP